MTPFGNYLLDSLIAEGGMARVYRARLRGALGFEKPLVVKQVLPQFASDPRFIEMFANEAKTLVRLSHPHIVPVYELGVVDGVYFIAMEYVDGAPLSAVLRDGPLPAAQVAALGVQVSDALHHAHARFGLVHRDVTPRNILIDDEGNARLVDFGIAARADSSSEAQSPEVFGTPGYMSPEQARGEHVGIESDAYSLACALHNALTGTLPDKGVDSDLPEPLRELLESMLKDDPTERLGDTGEVARRLRGWLAVEHPRGVGPELGQRASQARNRRGHGDSVAPPGAPDKVAPSNEPSESSSDGPSQALATAPILARAREASGPGDDEAASPSSTQPIERPATDSGTVPIPGRGPEPTKRVPWMAWLLGAVLAGSIGFMLLPSDRDPQTESADAGRADTGTAALVAEVDSSTPDTEGLDAGVEDADTAAVEVGMATATSTMMGTPVRARGALTVSATPWAEVRVDGQPIGTTPRRNVPLPAGVHRVELSNPALGRSGQVLVDVGPNETVRVVGDLSRSPVSIRTR